MRYLISDIHGCRQQLLELLTKIQFSEKDTLYVLGDVLDRGFDPIGTLRDLMDCKNVIFILGNHDYLFYYFVRRLGLDLMNFQDEEDKPLTEYDCTDFISGRADYTRRYFKDENTILVTGHTPTPHIREDKKAEVYIGNGHIALDCGCVFGGRLAAYCFETEEVTYVEGANRN